MGGGQIGFDYQFSNWVVGFEANYSLLASNNDTVAFPGGFFLTDRTRGLFSATGRLGYAWGPALLYFKRLRLPRSAHRLLRSGRRGRGHHWQQQFARRLHPRGASIM